MGATAAGQCRRGQVVQSVDSALMLPPRCQCLLQLQGSRRTGKCSAASQPSAAEELVSSAAVTVRQRALALAVREKNRSAAALSCCDPDCTTFVASGSVRLHFHRSRLTAHGHSRPSFDLGLSLLCQSVRLNRVDCPFRHRSHIHSRAQHPLVLCWQPLAHCSLPCRSG